MGRPAWVAQVTFVWAHLRRKVDAGHEPLIHAVRGRGHLIGSLPPR